MTELNKPHVSLYERLTAAGCETSSNLDTLLVVATPEARRIIREYEQEGGISNMTSSRKDDGRLWMSLRWHYLPFWEENPEEAPAPGMGV